MLDLFHHTYKILSDRMYKDIISYHLSENTSEADLLQVAKQVVNDWMKQQKGFIQWEIYKNKDGSWTDIVSWKSEDDAKQAEKNMVNIPNAVQWLECYKKGSISTKQLELVTQF